MIEAAAAVGVLLALLLIAPIVAGLTAALPIIRYLPVETRGLVVGTIWGGVVAFLVFRRRSMVSPKPISNAANGARVFGKILAVMGTFLVMAFFASLRSCC